MKKRERTRTASLGQRGLARRVGSVSVPRLGHGAVPLQDGDTAGTRSGADSGPVSTAWESTLVSRETCTLEGEVGGGDQLHPAPPSRMPL